MMHKPMRDMGPREVKMIDNSSKRKPSNYCEGGYAEGGDVSDDMDNEQLMDHCAVEMMHAVDKKDMKMFREALACLVQDIVMKLGSDSDEGEIV